MARAAISSTGLAVTGTITPTGSVHAAAGSVGNPSIAFSADQNTGLYNIGVNNIGVAANGAKVLDISTTGLGITGLATISSSTSATSSAGAIVATGGVSAKNLFITAAVATYDNTNPSIAFSSAGGALGFYSQSNTLYFASTAQRILGLTSTGLSFSINGDVTTPNIATDAAGASGFFAPANGSIAYSGGGTERFRIAATTGAATFAGAVAVGNTVGSAVAVASTHKVTMVIGGVTYYLLATNLP